VGVVGVRTVMHEMVESFEAQVECVQICGLVRDEIIVWQLSCTQLA
jgi:hypothetical protein